MPQQTLFKDPRITVHTVFVVESLRTGDLKTGEALYDDVLRPVGFPDNRLNPEFRRVLNKEEFWTSLRDVEEYAQAGGHPILHLEAHGSQTGIELASREHISWAEMMPLFRRVNRATSLNFVVVAAACSGFRLAFETMPLQPAPVRALIGPVRKIPGDVLHSAFRAFYTELFKTATLSTAVQAMNAAAPPRSQELIIETAESLFALAFHGYLRDHTSPRQMTERKKEILAEALRRIPIGQRNETRRLVDRELARRPPEQYFAELLATFFMHDTVPDAKRRFSLTWPEYVRWRDANLEHLP